MRGRGGVLFVVLLALLSACSSGGGGSQTREAVAFAQEYAEALTAHEDRVKDVQERGRAALAEGGDVLAVYGDLRAVVGEAQDTFTALDAPEELQPQYARLVELLEEQAGALDAVIAAAQQQDDAALSDGLQRFATQLVDFATAQQALQTALTSQQ